VPPCGPIRRRDPLSREAIVDAAIRILDIDGLDGFTMRRVAEALGTAPASLYWHVGSKDGLLDLVFDEVIGEQHIPTPPGCLARSKSVNHRVGSGQVGGSWR
jgi:AcrR family transcriptional regulator